VFKLVGDIGLQCLIAILKEAKHAAMNRKVVVRRFVQGQEVFLGFRFDSAVVNVDETFGGVVNAEDFRKSRFNAGAGFGGFAAQIAENGGRVEKTGRREPHIGGGENTAPIAPMQ
jgi:hypothetical protein